MGNFLVLGEISSVRPLPRRCSIFRFFTGDDAPAHGARQGQHVFAHGGIHPLSTTTSITTFTSKAGSTINMEEDTISQPPFPSKPKHLNQEIFPQQRISHPFHTSLTGKSPHSVHSALRDFPRVSMFAHLRRRVLLPVTHAHQVSRPTR